MSDDIQLPPEVEALALKKLETTAAKMLGATKAEFGQSYPEGRRETFRSPVDDLRIGQVWRTDPDPEWRITDRAALMEHLASFPGNVVSRMVISEEADEAEVIAVLMEYADHLLDEVSGVPDEVVKAALDQSKATGTAAAPGISKVKPGGVLTVAPDKNAHLAIEGLVRAGLLSWDGRRRELPSSDERKAS